MKFKCEREPFLKAISDAARGIPAKPERPILSCLHLSQKKGTLTATGTDMHIWIQSKTQVETDDEPWTSVVNARLFVEAVKSCVTETITVNVGKTSTKVISGTSVFEFNTLPADDYPEFPKSDTEDITIDSATLVGALAQVATARSSDENRTVLTSILVEPAEFDDGTKGFKLVCTDSYRLALRELRGLELTPVRDRIMIPARAAEELVKHATDNQPLVIGFGADHIDFNLEKVRIFTRLIEGEYPKYNALLPDFDSYPTTVTMTTNSDGELADKEDFTRAVSQVRIMAGADAPVRLNIGSDKVALTSKSDFGEGQTDLNPQIEGAELSTAFNPKYLMDGIESCPGDELKMYLVDELKPAVLRGQPEEGFLYLLMPVRTSD